MYFKQIELTGFKSFADRTVVKLEEGMTAIVGPNGCGKSNILDAIRWCLGEQSAKALRGNHMQDIIFNGSETRQATGMAEVSLTFDNADNQLPVDFSEVQVTRRIYRSGESEYLLNKAPCRLRDIQELFMDTGVGTSAYSLIGQGKIAMVLSSKPEDRRYLFEEAAGIIKYKSRKKVAMRKLESAEQNLLRLSDIILEVQRQMRNLKRQVNAAIRYRELMEELRGLELRSGWIKFTEYTTRIAELKQSFAKAQDRYEQASGEMSQIEARYEELGLAKLEVDRVLLARREGVHQIDTEMEKIENQIALLRQQIDFSKEQQEQATREQAMFEERAQDLAAQQTGTSERGRELDQQLADARAMLETRQHEHEALAKKVQEADEHLEAVRSQSVQALHARNRTQTEIETLGVQLANIETQLEAVYARQQQDDTRIEELVARLADLRAQQTADQARQAALESARTRAHQDEQAQSETLGQVNGAWQDLREKRGSSEARLHSLRELRDSYEGFATGVRAIMMAKQRQIADVPGIIGPVGDLISTEKTYERAMEAALGGNINNIVCASADDAKAAVTFLKQNKAGRVTFLPLDTIRASQHDDSNAVKGYPGVVGMAIKFAQYDPAVRGAIEYLFHNTTIVETIDDAIRIARSERRFPRLVTLDGEVVSSAGAVTGGRTKHESRGLIGRSAEITELEERVEAMAAELAAMAQRATHLTDAIQALRNELATLGSQETDTRKTLGLRDVEIARLATELTNLEHARAHLNEQRDVFYAKREAIDAQRQQALSRAGTMESDDESLQGILAEAQQASSYARQTLADHGTLLSDLRVHVAELGRGFEEAQRDQVREQREREQALAQAHRRQEQIGLQAAQQQRLSESIAQEVERAKALSETKEQARAKVVEAENQRQTLLDESDGLEKALKELRERERAAQADVHRLEIDLRHHEDLLTHLNERILEEYQVSLAALDVEIVGADELSDSDRDRRIKEIRTTLQRMGPVNLGAIEEYDALTERNDFLVAQDEDLRKAKDTLLQVVARIDTTIRDMFMETFHAVSNNFRDYFRRLFNGGQARVYLLDEDDPLESGIEIEARPPGKKPQSISLLSGGEQAMTAIALLFSIFRAKPSPFCVLDEVDAPLDDANIGRFLSMLSEFVGESQFIVITHNKQTMTHADVLYGVTQQERGISQLVSVRFEQDRESEPDAA
jgi:chromosome segregation protein